jgi:tRNA(Ser,Leu) C12 N-acetylase TAN1
MQATCFSSKDEIRGTAKVLLEKMFQPLAAKSFAISAKRRQCGHINRSEIIDTIAELVLELKPQCIVDLTSPDVTIVVEVCRALCGISVVPKIENFHNNFSLIAAREDNGSTTSDKN